MPNLLDSLKSSKFRHGSYATVMIVAALAVVVAVNLLVDQIPWKADLTENKLYTLSDQTNTVLDSLVREVIVTTVATTGGEDLTISAILEKYASRSDRIKLATIDPERNPGWAKQYSEDGGSLSAGSIVVATPQKFRTISPWDMYNYDYSDASNPQITSLTVEQRVTSALMYVTSEKQTKAYALQGHGEVTLAELALSATIGYENYEMVDLNLLTVDSVPSDADLLMVIAPGTDFTKEDVDKIHTYLTEGGRAIFLFDLPEKAGARRNIAELVGSYGLDLREVLAVEGDSNSMAAGNPLYLLPTMEYHAILQPLRDKNLPLLVPFAQTLAPLELRKQTLRIEPLLSSSENSWAKVDYANMTSTDKESGDVEGPLLLAVAITDPAVEPSKQDTKLIIVGSSVFLDPSLASQVPGNVDFFVNSVSWLTDKTESISIRPKDLLTMRLNLNETQTMVLSGLVVILLPILILGAGVVIWLRRRHL